MIRTAALTTALTSALLLGAPIAMAAGQPESEATAEHQNPAELKAFQNAKLSLLKAISIAEQNNSGKAVDASFEERGGPPGYRVKVYHNNSVWEGLIDANTGKLIGQAKTTPENQLDQEDKAELAAVRDAKVTLAGAVTRVEEHTSGKAIDAGIEERNGKSVYELEIVTKNGAVQSMTVDPMTGQLSAGPSARSGSTLRK